jgi:sialate O-acetylesterase
VSCGSESVTLDDIVVGDVWLAMGQSNMEYFLRYDADWDHVRMDVLRKGPDRSIRMYNTPQIAYEGQEDPSGANGVWFCEEDEPWRSFSAPGYYFAKYLRAQGITVPVAIVGCNWGGTPAQAWMSREYLEKPPLDRLWKNYIDSFSSIPENELKQASMKAWESERSYDHVMQFAAVLEGLSWDEQLTWMKEHEGDPEIPMGPWHHYRPCGVYDTMVRKIAPFSVKGILWYQGESNSGEDASIYQATMEALVSCLRSTWQDDTLPFCFMQIAPFTRWLGCTGEGYAVVRHQQDLAAASIPGCYMSNVMDLGEHDDIHPKFKKEVGRRLALLALGHVYGQAGLCPDAPGLLDAAEIQPAGSKSSTARRFRLTFNNCGSALAADSSPDSVICVYTQQPDSHSIRWDEGDCSLLTQRYFTELTGFDYSAPVPVRDVEISSDSVSFSADLDKADSSICISFAESDWCEVTLRSSDNVPAKPFHTIL